jgi:hypothetical protein
MRWTQSVAAQGKYRRERKLLKPKKKREKREENQ